MNTVFSDAQFSQDKIMKMNRIRFMIRSKVSCCSAFILLVLTLILCTSCHRTEKTYYRPGVPKVEMTYSGKKLDGIYRMWYQTGALKQQAFYKNDKLEGKLESWYPNGNRELQEEYANGVRNGKSVSWDEFGNKKEEKNYRNDTLDGKYQLWYESGIQKIDGNYKKGMFDGKWQYYSQFGTLVGEGIFQKGCGVLVGYGATGHKIHEVHYIGNKREGDEIEYNADGSIKNKTVYKQDRIIEVLPKSEPGH